MSTYYNPIATLVSDKEWYYFINSNTPQLTPGIWAKAMGSSFTVGRMPKFITDLPYLLLILSIATETPCFLVIILISSNVSWRGFSINPASDNATWCMLLTSQILSSCFKMVALSQAGDISAMVDKSSNSTGWS